MDEEMLKRNTDCVFFLASPLTCKKGMECEYRHSEIARLNPRDCWYWLAGNCLNPACAFRHPPLDVHDEATPKTTVSSHQTADTVKKTNVPCYYYYSGFCSKGASCSFSHGPDWFTPPTGKSLKDSNAVPRKPVPNDDTVMRNAIGSNPRERKLGLSTNIPKTSVQSQPASHVLKLSEPPQISVAEIEVAPVEVSRSLLPAGPTIRGSRTSTNRGLEERVMTEEQWTDSRGFHVSSNGNNSESMRYEDDQEEYSPPYVQHEEEEEEELDSPSSDYEFEEPSEYDPANPRVEVFTECGAYDSWRNSVSARKLDNGGIVQDEYTEIVPDFVSPGKRNLLRMELEIGDCPDVVDLRDCLTRRRGNEGHSASWLLRRHNSFHPSCYGRTRLGRNGFSQRLRTRLTAFVGKNPVGSLRGYGFPSNGMRKHDFFMGSRVQSFKKHKGKRPLQVNRASRYPFSRRYRSSGDDSAESSGINSSVDFQGPKPLSELLKNKIG